MWWWLLKHFYNFCWWIYVNLFYHDQTVFLFCLSVSYSLHWRFWIGYTLQKLCIKRSSCTSVRPTLLKNWVWNTFSAPLQEFWCPHCHLWSPDKLVCLIWHVQTSWKASQSSAFVVHPTSWFTGSQTLGKLYLFQFRKKTLCTFESYVSREGNIITEMAAMTW